MGLRRIVWLMLALSLIWGSAAAEELKQEASRAVAELEAWNQKITELTEESAQEEEQLLGTKAQNSLSLAETVVLLTAYEEVTSAQSVGDIIQRERGVQVKKENRRLETEVFWLDAFGCYVSCDLLYREGYMYETNSMYDSEGTYLGTEILELGERDGQFVMLLIRYDAGLGATARYALLNDGESSSVVDTMTLGMHLDIVLDVDAWQSGSAQWEAWSKRLLLPAQAQQ